ncbi:MAG: GxxExxY protein [Gemmatimonadaceae bacterium]|nr:GxxExxY protein [Gemmatimonadaceae bacterium]
MPTRTSLLHAALTQSIIGACYEVYNELGWGYAEVVYAEALACVLEAQGTPYVREQVLQVWFRRRVIGVFRADLVVDNRVIVELKACNRLQPSHEAQLINYLRGSGLQVGLLFNFGPKPEVRRLIWTPTQQRLMND